jgi:REP element-mobilizing transposase RayT
LFFEVPMTEMPHSHHLRLHRDMQTPGTWFVTKCLEPKRPVLIDTGAVAEIIAALAYCVQTKKIAMGSFVIMPDHWHAVLASSGLSATMHSIDTWIGSKTAAILQQHQSAWQDSYHDTRICSTRQFLYTCHYIEENPVRKGLSSTAEEWPWSSAKQEHQHMIQRPWPWDFPGDHK